MRAVPEKVPGLLMTYGTLEDILTAKKYFSDAGFEAVLSDAPPGIFDPASWHYWNGVYHHIPVPPLPERKIP